MNPDRFTTTLGDLITSKLADVHTSVPAKITAVNYGNGTASAQPLVKTVVGTSKTIPYPELKDIPIVVSSGNAGKSKITFPIKPGDTVLVVFSERDPSNFLQSSGENLSNPQQNTYLGLFPIAIIPCLSAGATVSAIDSENIIIQNELSVITLKPDGTLIFGNGILNLEAKPDGNFVVNGAKITPEGNVVTKNGVDLDAFYQKFLIHEHSGVQSGGDNSGPPVGV